MLRFYPLQNQSRPYANSDGALPAPAKDQLQEMRRIHMHGFLGGNAVEEKEGIGLHADT